MSTSKPANFSMTAKIDVMDWYTVPVKSIRVEDAERNAKFDGRTLRRISNETSIISVGLDPIRSECYADGVFTHADQPRSTDGAGTSHFGYGTPEGDSTHDYQAIHDAPHAPYKPKGIKYHV